MSVKVRERPKGSGVWWLYISHRGQRKTKKVGSFKAAKEVALKIEAKLAANTFKLDPPPGAFPTMQQYAKKWNITEEEVRQKYIDQVPMKRGCTYDDVSNVVVFLASDQSSYMTGQAINVTGGQEMR